MHSDDGFALRFIGAPFDSVTGTGVRDDDFPEYMGFLNTGACTALGVLKGIPAGEYSIEFAAFQRAASAAYEVYAAEGVFQNDSDTDQWQLIGASGGLEILAGPKGNLKVRSLARLGDRVTIEFDSPKADSPHQLQESVDLKSWQAVTGATFTKLAAGLQVSAGGATSAARFYRVVLHP